MLRLSTEHHLAATICLFLEAAINSKVIQSERVVIMTCLPARLRQSTFATFMNLAQYSAIK